MLKWRHIWGINKSPILWDMSVPKWFQLLGITVLFIPLSALSMSATHKFIQKNDKRLCDLPRVSVWTYEKCILNLTGMCVVFFFVIEFHTRFSILLVPIACIPESLAELMDAVPLKINHVCRRVWQIFITVCSIINPPSIYKIISVFINIGVLKSITLSISLDSQTFEYGMTCCEHLTRVLLSSKNMILKAILFWMDHWEIFPERLDSYNDKAEPQALIKMIICSVHIWLHLKVRFRISLWSWQLQKRSFSFV